VATRRKTLPQAMEGRQGTGVLRTNDVENYREPIVAHAEQTRQRSSA